MDNTDHGETAQYYKAWKLKLFAPKEFVLKKVYIVVKITQSTSLKNCCIIFFPGGTCVVLTRIFVVNGFCQILVRVEASQAFRLAPLHIFSQLWGDVAKAAVTKYEMSTDFQKFLLGRKSWGKLMFQTESTIFSRLWAVWRSKSGSDVCSWDKNINGLCQIAVT